MRVVGISGKMGTGKTTLAKFMLSEFPEFTRVAFADILKKEVSEQYGIPLIWCYDQKSKENLIGTVKLREILQFHGSVRRGIDPDYWIKAFDKEYSRVAIKGIIIDDVRFPNEAEYVKASGGYLIRLDPYEEYTAYNDHESETALDEWDGFNTRWRPPFGGLMDAALALSLYVHKHFAKKSPCLKRGDVARLLGLNPRTVDRMWQSGKLPPPTYLTPRSPRWYPGDIAAIVEGARG